MTRLAPLDPPYEPKVDDALKRLMGPVDAEPLNLFRTIAHHDALLDRFRQIGSSLLSFGRLPTTSARWSSCAPPRAAGGVRVGRAQDGLPERRRR
jgi:hypothetical protein